MIYTEPFVVTGGGPGNSTTFLSIELVKLALGQFDLGKAAAMSIVYMLIIIIACWVFYTVMTNAGEDRAAEPGARDVHPPGRRVILALFIVFLLLPIYWLINMSFKTNVEITSTMTLWPSSRPWPTTASSSPIRAWYLRLHQFAQVRGHQYAAFGLAGDAGGLRLRATASWRQAPVLLAADQPHGPGGGVRPAVLQSLFGDRTVRHAMGRGAGALPVQHSAGGVDP